MSQIIKNLRQIRIFWIVSLFSLTFSVSAKFSENVFVEYPTGLVFSLYKGDNAFWIGSENGLFAVSGKYVKKFDYSNSPFFGADIKGILEDSNGRVWVTTFGKGVYVLTDYAGEKAKIESVVEINQKYCRNLIEKQANIYVSCQSGIYIKSNTSSKFEKLIDGTSYRIKDITDLSISNHQVYFVDSKKRLIKIDNGLFTEIDLVGMSYSKSSINSLTADSQGAIWVGTDLGIIKIIDETFAFYPTDQNKGSVSYIFEKSKGEIWFFQDTFKKFIEQENGAFKIDPVEAFNNLKKQDIYDVQVLDLENFVFSSPLSGISTYSDLNSNIATLNTDELEKNNIQYSAQSKSRGILLGIDGNLYEYNLELDEYLLLVSDLGFINSIYELDSNKLIISSDRNGLFMSEFNEHNEEILRESILIPNDGYVSDMTIRGSNLYFGVVGGENAGIYVSKNFEKPTVIRSGIHVDHIVQTADASIYFELRFIGLVSLKNIHHKNLSHIGVSSSNTFVKNCLKESTKGFLLTCSDGGGLGVISLNTNKINYLNSSLTGGSLYIRDLVEDTDGYYWVTTNQGLVRLDLENKLSIKLGKESGIVDNDFEITASIKLPDNKILIAGDNLNYLIDSKKANHLVENRTKKTTSALIVHMEVSERERRERIEKSARLFHSLKTEEPLIISYEEYLFSITLAANNFLDRHILGFEYRLLGLDDSWFSAPPNDSTATYSTLPAGDYTFQVRVKDPKSYVDQPITSLKIKVLPPFWQTWQAYSLYIVLAIALLFLFLKYRTKQLEMANKKLESAVLDRTNELAKSESKIIDLLKQKESLFAHASHEIRTPLSLILGPLQKLGVTLNGKDQKKQFELISRNANRLTVLVDQILELEKLDSAKNTQMKNYSIGKSLASLVASFQSIAELKSQQLIMHEFKHGVASLTEDSLEKIVSNLLLNAVRYCPYGAKIEVSTSINKGNYVLIIADNGPGISSIDQTKIFDRFTRTQNSENVSGTGLGLAVVKELLIANEGSICVESEEGEGTTFIVSLPLSNENVEAELNLDYPKIDVAVFADEINEQKNLEPIESTKELKNETILIIEDNTDMRSFLVDLLSKYYDCIEAENGVDGLSKAIEFLPDLIVTDLMMPLSNGFELTENIRSNELTAHIPIVLLTAKGDDSSRMKGWKKAVDDYISKPFNNDELILRIANIISIRKIISRKFGTAVAEEDATELTKLNLNGYYSERDRRFFDKFIAIVEEHYHQESFNRGIAADLMCVSERQLNRKLNALIDYSFSDYLRKFRLDKAKKALENGRQITEVAYMVGFSAASYFSHCFKAEFGVSPKTFVDKLKNT